jgi:DNA-binding beta-propeller fold protein YncE
MWQSTSNLSVNSSSQHGNQWCAFDVINHVRRSNDLHYPTVMSGPVLVGSDKLSFRVEEHWEQLPSSYSHGDVAGIAVDSEDRVYVFNRSEHPVMVYRQDGSFVRSWGEGVFNTPHGITIDSEDVVFCTDHSDHTVRKFTREGELLQVLGTPGAPSDSGVVGLDYRTIQRGAPPFNGPTNLAVAPSGDLFVSDGYGNACIHRFSSAGELKASWGGPGSGPGQFNVPHGVAVDWNGRVLVADRENNRVQIFSADGQFIDEWKGLARPCDFSIDQAGNIFVAELGPAGPFSYTPPFAPDYPPSRVSVFDGDGNVIARWGTKEYPCAPGSFYAAHGVCVDSHGDLYVGEVNRTGSLDEFDRPIRAHSILDSLPTGCHTLQKFVRMPSE